MLELAEVNELRDGRADEPEKKHPTKLHPDTNYSTIVRVPTVQQRFFRRPTFERIGTQTILRVQASLDARLNDPTTYST